MPIMQVLSGVAIRRSGPRSGSFLSQGVRVLVALMCVCSLFILPGIQSWAAGGTDRLTALHKQHHDIHAKFAADIETLAASCEQNSLESLAAEIRQLGIPLEQQPGNIDNLPTTIQLDVPVSLPAAERAAKVRVRKLRTDYSNALFSLSRKALKDRHPSFAYRLVREVLFQDPDHALARALMGFRRAGSEWTTPFAADKKRRGLVWHKDFGWILSEHVARYAAGERLYKGNWITAEREELQRAEFRNAWVVETEHFQVKTNHSLQKGAHLATSVEVFHHYFMREFAAFFQKPQQLDKLFKDGTGTRSGDRYDIDHFRLQSEFINRLAKQCPSAGQINGLYLPQERKAFFFHNPALPDSASLEPLYHEVTHQLLSESSMQSVPVGHSRDFWVIEGIACYFESFHVAEDGSITVGDINHPRIQAARDQVMVNLDYEPLARFTASGMLAFQKGELPVLQRRYAQATGLTHFFLNYQDGLYRDGFIEYLAQIYSPDERVRAKAKTLEQILLVSNAALDEQYKGYIRGMEQQAAVRPEVSRRK